jgi:hypothetical protein
MSTKTTFKRIALVTVAALGFGVMSVAPSNAATPAGLTSTLSAAATTVQTGEAAKTTLTTAGIFGTADTVTVSAALTSWPAAATNASLAGMLVPTLTAVDTDIANTVTGSNGSANQGASNGIISSDAAATVLLSARTTVSVTPGAANTPGTYVYTITTKNDATVPLTISTITWTLTVAAPVLGKSTAFISTTLGAATADSTTLAKTLTTDGVAETTAVAEITVNQYQDAAGTVAMNSSYTKAVEVSISGAGSVGSTSSTSPLRGTTATTAAAIAGTTTATATQSYWVYADGRTGTATITIKVDGAVVATKSFKFTGKLAKLATTASKKNVGVGETMTLTTTGADVNANATATPVVTAVSADPLIATVSADGATVTGVKAGTTTVTLTSGTVTLAVPVTVLPVTAATLAWKFDKDSYDAGEKMTLTVTASGVADGARAVFTASPVANFGLSSGSDTVLGSPVFAAGVATYTLYAPATPGKFTITGTVNFAGVDTEAAIKTAATTYVASVATISATITNPALTAAQEATDAANEATDAGNNAKDAADQAIEAADAATIAAQDAAAAAEAAGEMAVEAAEAAGAIAQDALDAANAATDAALSAAEAADAATAAATEAKESADAATAAVAELSTKVAALMAALNAKVTTLSNLVAKIAKKVKA